MLNALSNLSYVAIHTNNSLYMKVTLKPVSAMEIPTTISVNGVQGERILLFRVSFEGRKEIISLL